MAASGRQIHKTATILRCSCMALVRASLGLGAGSGYERAVGYIMGRENRLSRALYIRILKRFASSPLLLGLYVIEVIRVFKRVYTFLVIV